LGYKRIGGWIATHFKSRSFTPFRMNDPKIAPF
jgi:hypothetical protein